MSQSFVGYTYTSYKGSLYASPFAASPDPKAQPVYAPLTINWNDYFVGFTSNAAISVNLGQGTQSGLLQKILSCYVDNLNNKSSVYVSFPDSLFTIRIGPNEQKCFPVITNSLTPNIFCDTYTFNAQTLVFFANVGANYFDNASGAALLGGSLGSAQVALSQNILPNVLGDTYASADFNFSLSSVVSGNQYSPLVTFGANRKLIITGLFLTSLGLWARPRECYFNISLCISAFGFDQYTLFDCEVSADCGKLTLPPRIICQLSNLYLNIVVAAPDVLNLRVTATGATTPYNNVFPNLGLISARIMYVTT